MNRCELPILLENILRSELYSTAQGWTTCPLAVHERTSVHFLVLPGSLLSITEITEYTSFSSSKPIHELRYKSELNIVPMELIIEPMLFL